MTSNEVFKEHRRIGNTNIGYAIYCFILAGATVSSHVPWGKY